VDLYFYVQNDPVNRVDPMGKEDIYVRGDQAYWVVEERGNVWDSDLKEIWLGGVANGQIWLSQEFGGGSISVERATEIARGHFYMNEMDDNGQKFQIRKSLASGLTNVTSKAETDRASAFAEGLKGGASIVTNTGTFGLSDSLGWTNSLQYQGGVYDASRLLATGSFMILYTATGQPVLMYGGRAMAIGSGTYHVAQGVNAVQAGDSSGWWEIGLGATAVAGNLASVPVIPVPRTTVLGSYPQYVTKGESLGANIFNIEPKVWNGMTPAARWAANQRFLDQAISRGDDIILATSGHAAKPGTTFFREIEYLLGKGYTISDDGMRMLPPGVR
jgi:hypothetical protein